MNCIVFIKRSIAVFLALVLITGTIALSSPSFKVGDIQAQRDYGMDNSYDKKPYENSYEQPEYPDKKYDSYGYSDYEMNDDRKLYDNSYYESQHSSYNSDYKPKYSSYGEKDDKRDKSNKDSKSVSINKIKCINTNININGKNAGNISLGNKNAADGHLGANVYGDSGYGGSGEGYYNDGYNNNKKDKGSDCIINNNNTNTNTGGIPPTNATGTLTVIKNVDCQVNMTFCATNPISPSNFTILVEGNNPSQTSFPGSDTGTDVELQPGAYNVTEEGLQTPTPHVCSREGFDAGSSFGNNLFICTNFSDGCDGDITAGSTQTCEITNVLIFCDVDEVDTITGFSEPKDIAYDPVHEEMYVVNQGGNNVIRIDTTSNPPAIIGTPITVGSSPFGILNVTAHNHMYVSNGEGTATTVSVIDTNTNAVITTIDLGAGTGPFEFAYDPIHDQVYVTNLAGNNVFRIDAGASPPVLLPGSITVENTPWGIAFDGTHFMYVANFGSDSVSVIDTNTNTVIGSPILVGDGPTDVTYDPDLKRMYVTNFTAGTVSVIDTTTNTVIATIPPAGSSFNQPVYATYDPVCKDMYVTNQGGNTVSIIDTTTNTVIDTITVGSNPIGIEYDPVKDRMFVANSNFGSPPGNATVSVISLCDCPPVVDEGSNGNGSIESMLHTQASLLHENSLTTNAKPEAGISTFSEKTSPSSFSPPSIPANGDSSDALAKITKLKQQWLDLLP